MIIEQSGDLLVQSSKMSIHLDKNNHPYILLGDGFTIRFNRAPYEEDKELRIKTALSDETAAALAEFQRLAALKSNLNLVVDQSNWTVMVHLRCFENDAQKAFAVLDHGYRLLYREPTYVLPYAQIRHVFEQGFIRYLPEYDDDGAIIVVVEMGGKLSLTLERFNLESN